MIKFLDKNYLTKIINFLAISTLVIALGSSWISGKDDLMPFVKKVLPEAQSLKIISTYPLVYEGVSRTQSYKEEKIGYVVIDQANAYGGPIKIATGIDLKGHIIGAVIVSHNDTPSFIQIIMEHKYLDQFIGKSITEPLSITKDIDQVSGATYSSRGIAKAISQGSHAVATNQFSLDVPNEIVPFKFGPKESIILALVILMMIGVFLKIKRLRWVILIGSLIFIGFQYNTPISLANIASLFMGNFPAIRENLVWYVFLIGIPIITFIAGKNVYCYWLCPFGALQEITAKAGGGKLKCNRTIELRAKKIRYILVYLALLGAFLTKSPGSASYEPFAILFGLQGFGVQWLILPVVLFTSLFISRFWCRFFCPGMVINEVILLLRKSVMRLGKRLRTRTKNDFADDLRSINIISKIPRLDDEKKI